MALAGCSLSNYDEMKVSNAINNLTVGGPDRSKESWRELRRNQMLADGEFGLHFYGHLFLAMSQKPALLPDVAGNLGAACASKVLSVGPGACGDLNLLETSAVKVSVNVVYESLTNQVNTRFTAKEQAELQHALRLGIQALPQ